MLIAPHYTRTVRVGRSLHRRQYLHIANVVYVKLRLQYYHEPLAVEPYRQDRRAEGHFAYCGLSLSVVYSENTGREGEGDERGREEHLQARDISFARLGVLAEGICRVDAVAFGGTCADCLVHALGRMVVYIPTPSWLWSWLNVTKFMDVMPGDAGVGSCG